MSNLNLVGVDEAGRGAIAGPLVVASFLDCFSYPTYIKDSKKIKEEKREEIFDIFLEKKYIFGIGIVSNLYIDKCGILNAFKEGIYLSLNFICGKKSNLFDENFFEYYDFRKNYSLYYSELNRSEENFLILVDGNLPVIKEYKTIAVIDGDDRIPIISSASIVAKVVRDRIMRSLEKKFKDYNFSINKGYCTKEHLKNLEEFGISICHRKSFLQNFQKNDFLGGI